MADRVKKEESDVRQPTPADWIAFLANVPSAILLNSLSRRAKRRGLTTEQLIANTREQIESGKQEVEDLKDLNNKDLDYIGMDY